MLAAFVGAAVALPLIGVTVTAESDAMAKPPTRTKLPIRRPPAEEPPTEEPPPTEPTGPLPGEEAGALVGLRPAHDAARAAVGVGPLTWSPSLGRYAQAWAEHLAKNNGCKLAHRTGDSYGENLFWTTAPRDANYVVGAWVTEKAHYDHATNSCAAGQVCGHYTQVVWANTTSIGCGMAQCTTGDQIWVCNYDPQGNYPGQSPY